MSEHIVSIYTPRGIKVGHFVDPQIQMYPDHHYEISGIFLDHNGQKPGKVEFNPEALPYHAELNQLSKCAHKNLVRVYVQHGQPPVKMTGMCEGQV